MSALTAQCIRTLLGLILIGGMILPVQAQEAGNPLGDLLRRIDRGIRESGEELERQRSGRDLLDLRPIQRTEDERLLRQARELADSARWHDAIEIFQYQLNESPDAFSFRGTREFGSLHDVIDIALQALPEAGRRGYQSRFAPAAEHLLDQAQKTQDLALLRQVFNQYRQTPAGKTALNLAARLLEDQGEFAQAATLWERLLPLATDEERLAILTRAVRARHQSGQLKAAQQLGAGLPADALKALLAEPLIAAQNKTGSPSPGPFLTIPDQLTSPAYRDPLMTARWETGLIERYRIRRQLMELVSEMEEREIAPIPAAHPLLVNDRLVFRSLRSLQMRDARNGTLLWEHRLPGSPEEILCETHLEYDYDPESYQYQDESVFPQLPLSNLVFKDENQGSLSSDGLRLFSVELSGEALLAEERPSWNQVDDEQNARRPASSNELVAYDLDDGHQLWRIGGVQIEEQFSRALAGTFFLGPPLPDVDGLYILGERQGEITLFCLAPASGEVLWEQPLAIPGRPIGSEPVRAQWFCRPVIAEGLILCPTGCGWVVAVDQATHRLKWTTRFSQRVEQRQNYRSRYNMQNPQPINRRWHATAPFVVGQRLLLTPPELPDEFGVANPALYCLDILTGSILWEQIKSDRGDGTTLYLAGHWEDLAILVSQTTVTARQISRQGEVAWTVSLRGRPCGRGVIFHDKLFVPVSANRLAQIDLSKGKLELTLPISDAGVGLGNLTIGAGSLISMTPEQIAVFPLGTQSDNPSESATLVVKQELNSIRQKLSAGDWQSAIPSLTSLLKREGMSETQRRECLELQFEAVTLRLLTDQEPQVALQLLEETARSLNDLPRYQRLVADHLQKVGNWSQSLSLMLDLFEQASPHERIREEDRVYRIDSWIGGRLADLFASLPDNDAQSRFVEELTIRIERLPQDRVIRDRWSRALGFHRLGLQLELQLARQDFIERKLSAGLIRTQRVQQATDSGLRADALRLQAEQLSAIEWDQDALSTWELLAGSGLLTFSDGQPVAEVAQNGISQARARLESRVDPEIWKGTWRLERLGLVESVFGPVGVPLVGSGFRQLDSLRLLVDLNQVRLRVEDRRTGTLEGIFPLRQLGSTNYEATAIARKQGPTTVILNQGTLQSLNWADRKIGWNWAPNFSGAARQRAIEMPAAPPPTFQSFSQFLAVRQQYAQRDQAGYLLAGNERALLLLCRDWIALDPITGEELWRDQKAPARANASAVGTSQFAIQARNLRELRREIDGRPVTDDLQQDLISRSFGTIQGDFLILRRGGDQGPTMGKMERVAATGSVIWSLTVPTDAHFLQTDSRTLVWISAAGELSSVDLMTGKPQFLTTLTLPQRDNLSTLRVLSDADRFYILIDQGDLGSGYFSVPWIPLSGSIAAVDRSGKSLWTYTIPTRSQSSGTSTRRRRGQEPRWPMRFLVQKWQENPLLLLVADVPEESGEFTFHQVRVIGLDKRTGQVAVDWEKPSESGGVSYVHVDLEQRQIELRTYNDRLLISPVPTVDKSASGDPAP